MFGCDGAALGVLRAYSLDLQLVGVRAENECMAASEKLLERNGVRISHFRSSNSARTIPASCFAVGSLPFNSPGSFDCSV